MPMKRVLSYVSFAALWLAACSNPPSREDVIARAKSDGRIAFDVVKIDDAVLTTVLAQRPPAFHERFKKYLPPPDLKIAVGDTVSVVIWESAANGLFGASLTELSFPAGVVILHRRISLQQMAVSPLVLGHSNPLVLRLPKDEWGWPEQNQAVRRC